MAKFITLKDHYRESQYFAKRAAILVSMVVALFGLLVFRLYDLQVRQYEYHVTQSEKNRIRLEALPPTRGLIYDAKGRLLAENRPSYLVSVLDSDLETLNQKLAKVSELISVTPEEAEKFLDRARWSRRTGEYIPLRFNLTEQEIARLAVNQHTLPGVRVSADLVRYYPYRELTAHVVGYVGRINEREEARIDLAQYSGTHHIGKVGLEKHYEAMLLGEVGYQRIETNARGQSLRVLDQTPPQPGQDLTLFLDIDLQSAARKALGEQVGALVALDVASGGVKAMVSTPSFDPNLFVRGIGVNAYAALRDSHQRPLFNRVLGGQYPPGSTIKPFVALAGLETGQVFWSDSIVDIGYFQFPNEERRYRDWKRQGHGQVNMHRAIVESCDTYFYEMSAKVGIDAIAPMLTGFGFGAPVGIDLPGESSGLVPTKGWKQGRFNMPWFPGDTLNASIGQGYVLATPIQLATATAILARRGARINPKLLQQPTSGPETKSAELSEGVKLSEPQHWQRMIQSMEDVVHGVKGTARRSGLGLNYRMAGKTGTSQVKGIKQEEEYDASKIESKYWDHALFVAFAPAESPKIAVAVIVENGGGGGAVAAPMVREFMDSYFEIYETI